MFDAGGCVYSTKLQGPWFKLALGILSMQNYAVLLFLCIHESPLNFPVCTHAPITCHLPCEWCSVKD